MKKYILTFLAVIFAATIGVKPEARTFYDVSYYYDCDFTTDAGDVKAYDVFLEDANGEEIEIYLFADEFNGAETIELTADQINERRF